MRHAEAGFDDLVHLGAAQAVEEDDLVDPVEEFGPEVAHHLHDQRSDRLDALGLTVGADRLVGEIFRAQVQGS